MKLGLDQKELLKVLFDISLAIKKEIRDRTNKGIDMDGVAFKPYSDAYLRAKADYQSKGIISAFAIARASTVNLKLTGAMMRSKAISITKQKDRCEIFFPDKGLAIRAWTHHTGAGRMPQRKFFGVNDKDGARIYNKYMTPALDKVARFLP